MAIKASNFTMNGLAQSLDPLGHIPIKYLRMESVTGNADIKVGDKTLTATVYGFLLEDGAAVNKEIGPFGGGECPLNLGDIYVLGTDGQVIHLVYVTL